jgi:putative transposase
VRIFRFIAAKRAEHSIKIMCRVLEVSRSGFHAWARREPSARAIADRALTGRIAEIHAGSLKTYGSPRVHAELRLEDDVHVGRKRVERLMRRAGLSGQVKRRRGKTTIRVQGVRTAPDLVERDFNPTEPNRLWAADITYIRTWEGWLYLASVMDLYSRRIVGWALAEHLRAELVVDALEMAVARRRPDDGLVHHSDQGSQYTSLIFTRRCRAVGIDVSMGSRGDCFDTPCSRASTPASRRTSSTAAPGRPRPRRAPRCSTTSRRSTTAGGGTRRSGCSRPRTARQALSGTTVRVSPLRGSHPSTR